jgi:hypothetical protein
MYKHVQACTSMYKHVQACTSMYKHVQACTSMYKVCTKHIQIIYKSYTNHTQIIHKSYTNHGKIMSKHLKSFLHIYTPIPWVGLGSGSLDPSCSVGEAALDYLPPCCRL